MNAALFSKPFEIDIKTFEKPEPKQGEIRVKLQKIGICGSDVHIFTGHRHLPKPNIIGHEGLGIIDKIGKGVENRNIGERVAIEPNIPCLKCKYCRSGNGKICINKRVVGLTEAGCFAEYICLPEEYCWKIPDEVSDLDAVTIEPMAVAYHALFATKTQSGDTIAIIGLGAIGLLLTHLALRLGYKVFVTEIHQSKLKIAEEMGAIRATAEGGLDAQSKELAEIWLQNDVSAVFECAGSAFTASLATAAAPRDSEIVLVGLSEENATFQPIKITREGIHIIPSIIYNHPFDFKRVIRLIQSKIIQPRFIISRFMPFNQIESALKLASKGNDSKIVIEIE